MISLDLSRIVSFSLFPAVFPCPGGRIGLEATSELILKFETDTMISPGETFAGLRTFLAVGVLVAVGVAVPGTANLRDLRPERVDMLLLFGAIGKMRQI